MRDPAAPPKLRSRERIRRFRQFLRVATTIGSNGRVAASLGVADTTVKTHLSQLFEKTGVGRQADLVKLVAGFSTPLAN